MGYRTDFGRDHQRPLAVFASPGRYVQGPGATWELGAELKRLGLSGPVLFIAGGTARRTLASIWKETLPPVGVTPVVEAFGVNAVKRRSTVWWRWRRHSLSQPLWEPEVAKPPTQRERWPMNWICRW